MSEITLNAIRRFINEDHAVVTFDSKHKQHTVTFPTYKQSSEWILAVPINRELKALHESVDANGVVTFKSAWLKKSAVVRVTPADIEDMKGLALNKPENNWHWRVNYRLYGMGMIDIGNHYIARDQRWGWRYNLSPAGIKALESAGKTIAQLIAERDQAADKAKQDKDNRTVYGKWESSTVLAFTCGAYPKLVVRVDYSGDKPALRIDGTFDMGDLHFRLEKLLKCVDYMSPSKRGGDIGKPREWDSPTDPRRDL